MTRHWRKTFPYYKIQLYDRELGIWRDERRAYDSIDEATTALREKHVGRQARIMVVEKNRRRQPLA